MHAMQYEITLPADYDMGIIRERIRSRGPLLDDFPGLGVKAYCIRERGVDASPVNAYAPLYLWRTSGGMNEFLWGNGFRGLCADFGRPVVQHWNGLGYQHGPADGTPTAATKHVESLPADADPAAAVAAAIDRMSLRAKHSGVQSTAVGIDPRTWELVHLTLWTGIPDAPGTRYRVLHTSAPEQHRLPTGRHW